MKIHMIKKEEKEEITLINAVRLKKEEKDKQEKSEKKVVCKRVTGYIEENSLFKCQ